MGIEPLFPRIDSLDSSFFGVGDGLLTTTKFVYTHNK